MELFVIFVVTIIIYFIIKAILKNELSAAIITFIIMTILNAYLVEPDTNDPKLNDSQYFRVNE